jgi:hypothetical protein
MLVTADSFFTSCNGESQHAGNPDDTIRKSISPIAFYMDETETSSRQYGSTVNTEKELAIIDTLLQRSKRMKADSFEHYPPFVYFRSGNFLTPNETNALTAYCIDDSAYAVELYTLVNGGWIKNDRLEGLEEQTVFFAADFNDYNFDGQGDIYIQRVISNGIALSRGYLILVDPVTKKMEYREEAVELANMQPDPGSRTVISQEVIFCSNGMRDVCTITSKWIGGRLKTIKSSCPCVSE